MDLEDSEFGSTSQSIIHSELKLLDDIDFTEWSDGELSVVSKFSPIKSPPTKKIKHTHVKEYTDPYEPVRTGENSFLAESQYRYVVIDKEGIYQNAMIFKLKSLKDSSIAYLHLKDFWMHDQLLSIGCKVNIVEVDIDENNVFTIDRTGGYLVAEPDTLISITSILGQLWCPRQAAFAEKFHFPADSIDMFRGIICHDLITQAMLDEVKGNTQLNNILMKILAKPSIIQKAYGLRLEGPDLNSLAKELIPYVIKFMCTYFKTHSPVRDGLEVLGVRDIEDNYWNPTFGIKGKLDATISVKTKSGKLLTVPLEFKTGNPAFEKLEKVRIEHLGQVSLYTLLMRPRYGHVDRGVLYYIRETFWKECTVRQVELQQLVKLRNSLALSVFTKNGTFTDIPDPGYTDYKRCLSCPYKTTCSLLLKSEKDVTIRSPPTEGLLVNAFLHYRKEELDFFYNWFTLLTREIDEGDKMNNTATLWLIPPSEREKKGKCINNLELVTSSTMEVKNSAGEPRHLATFLKKVGPEVLRNVELRESDFVILGTSDELCICYCTIHQINYDASTVTVYMDVKLNERSSQPGSLFTLDKVSFKSPIAVQYSYLDSLFGDSPQQQRLREYIIFKKQPHFWDIALSRETLTPILEKYNQDQQAALVRSLKTDSFLFVKGMPGTGKTRTIVGLLELLVLWRKSILVVAYTGVAVDNILLQYKKISNDFIRVGDSSKLKYPELKQHYTSEICLTATGVDDFRTKVNAVSIIATTLLSLKHEIFKVRKFDYVIVDEASQALPTAVLGAIILAEKYILFGDPNQLPPILHTPASKRLDVEDNLFTMMASKQATTELSIQYRMNSTIMNLANKLVYEDKMKCASDRLANSCFHLPSKKVLENIKTLPSKEMRTWMSLVMSTKLIRAVMFFDTSRLINSFDTYGTDKSYRNEMEATIIQQCVKTFIQSGLPADELGLIAPYRGQVELLRTKCKALGESYVNIEVNTVDQYQGREKTVIICSFTRNCISEVSKEGEQNSKSILDDLRRLNVAITRAKKKLIMIGAQKFLRKIGIFEKLFSNISSDQMYQFNWADVMGL